MRLDAIDLAEYFLVKYQSHNEPDRYARYVDVVRLMYEDLRLPIGDVYDTHYDMALDTVETAMFQSGSARVSLSFRAVVYYAIILILSLRYGQELTRKRQLRIISESIVAEIPFEY